MHLVLCIMYNYDLEYNLYSTGAPTVSSLSLVPSNVSSPFTLRCTSTVSPATTAILTKDGGIMTELQYSMHQILKDGTSATYDTYFNIIDANPEELVGTYSCSILNFAGASSSDSLTIQGLSQAFFVFTIQ